MLRAFTVFNVAQVEGIEALLATPDWLVGEHLRG